MIQKPVECVRVTYSGPVLPYKPQVVAEQGQNTDAEHGRHKKKKQYMEFGLSVWQLILEEREREEEESKNRINYKFTLKVKQKKKAEE